jgi:endonuclease/exonuclease/phosphatase family metal-dependent hydrolase
MALRNKWEQLARLEPDVAVIQECETEEKWPQQGYSQAAWYGSNQNKGLAVVTFGPWRVEACEQLDPSIEFVLPARISGPKTFNLLGVWTKQSPVKGQSYIGQMHRAAQVYSSWLSAADSVVIGDWNSNAQWDRAQKANHSATVALLSAAKLESAYHTHNHCIPGRERHPTWYNHKRAERGFHIDYCFVPQSWLAKMRSVSVGQFDQWRPFSDHCPLVVDFAE